MSKRTINRFFWPLCLCLLYSIIWADKSTLAKNNATVSMEKVKTEILIGAHLPLSGAMAMIGAEQKWAYERAVEDINKAGGIYIKEYNKKLPVRLVVMDDETNPKKAADIVEQLITQTKVDFLLSGHSGAHGVLPGLITAEKYNKYYHGAVIWVPDFLEHNFKWGSMYFFDMAQGGAIPFEIWNTLPEDQRPQKPALFLEETFDGKQIGELWITLAEKYGYRIVLWESMVTGAKDFSAQINKAKAMGVDAILLMANTEETITLVRQMKENNFNVKFFHGMKGTWATEFYEALGKNAEYIFCDGFWSEDYPFPAAKELGKRYCEEHGKHSVSVGMYYALCQILWQAIEKAGTLDSARVRQAVLYNEFDTVMGKVDYDDRGIALFPLAQFQWWQGKQQIVYPFKHSNFKVKIAPPWDKRKEKKEILIGAHLPLSGAGAMVAVEQKWAYERAVENINKAGGIYVKQYGEKLPVRLVIMDDETDPVKADEVVEQLITQTKVDFLLSGFTGTHAVLPGLITADKYHKYYHGSVIWVPDFLEHNFQWGTMYFFDMAQGGATAFEVMNSLSEEQRPQKPAIFVEDTSDGKQIGDMWATLAEKYGYKIALRESLGAMGIGTKDFSAQIIRAKSMGVDAIILLANTEEAATLVRQMKEFDFSVKFFYGMKGTWATEFYESLGKNAEYIFCDGFWSEDYPFAGAKELGELYYKEFRKHSVSAGMYYALCQILWQAIERAGTLDSAKVHQVVLDDEFDTVMGKVDYDDRGIAIFPLATFQWWNGKQEVVYPFEYSKFKVKIAPPWDKRKEKKEILIGAHLPLSGVGSLVGAEQKWAYDRAVEDVNKAGGIYVREYGRKLPVHLVIIDDESDPIKAAAAVERLITQRKVDILLSGQVGAMGVIPGMITAEKYEKYYHGTVIWVPDFLKHNFEWCTMYFFDIPQGGATAFETWNSLPEDQHPQKPAIFAEDTTDGKQIGNLWAALAEKYGYKIALQEFIALGAEDYSTQILKAKSMGVDAILFFGNVPEAVTLVRQMKKIDFSVRFFYGMKGTWATEFYEALGTDADYIFCDGFWSMDYPFAGAKELGEHFHKDFGKYSVGAGMYYAVCQILWQAIEEAGTLDSAKVRQAVLDNEFETVMGKVDYDERGVALFPLAEFQWWNGKQEVVYPFKYSKFKVKIAPPWDERQEERELKILMR